MGNKSFQLPLYMSMERGPGGEASPLPIENPHNITIYFNYSPLFSPDNQQ
jgi:hypothetical protein